MSLRLSVGSGKGEQGSLTLGQEDTLPISSSAGEHGNHLDLAVQ
jgi:hypothetical protein